MGLVSPRNVLLLKAPRSLPTICHKTSTTDHIIQSAKASLFFIESKQPAFARKGNASGIVCTNGEETKSSLSLSKSPCGWWLHHYGYCKWPASQLAPDYSQAARRVGWRGQPAGRTVTDSGVNSVSSVAKLAKVGGWVSGSSFSSSLLPSPIYLHALSLSHAHRERAQDASSKRLEDH